MSNNKLKLDANSQAIVNYIQKYINNNNNKNNSYNKLIEVINHPKLENEFSDLQWGLIIEEAWQLAYDQAMLDNVVSLEERHELNNIYQLVLTYKNTPSARIELNYKILNTFKYLAQIDAKEDLNEREWMPDTTKKRSWFPPTPKPTPWNT